MCTSRCVNELACDTNSSTSFSDATFENVTNPQFSTHLLNLNRLSLVREGRVTGDDEQGFEARQSGDDVLDDAISKVLLLWIARHVLEGQHGNRRLIRKRK